MMTYSSDSKTLTVIVPVYNEAESLPDVICRLKAAIDPTWQVIAIDDGSDDDSVTLLNDLAPDSWMLLAHEKNRGKTAAIRTAILEATGNWVIVHDADLEYSPSDIRMLLEAASRSRDPVALYGRRPSFWNKPSRWTMAAGVLAIDILLYAVYRRWVRDHASCYKLLPLATLKSFNLQSSGFEGCVEITSKLMRSGIQIQSRPINYTPRSKHQGKKLTWRDGVKIARSVFRWTQWEPHVVPRESELEG